jgi:hypothetical protein
MSKTPEERDAVVNGQGSTLLWTEHYGTGRTRVARVAEALRDAAFGLALVVMAAGVAGFLTIERPTARSAAAVVANRAL